MRNKDGVQRGSVLDLPQCNDPLTPGKAAVPGVERRALKDAETLTKIPDTANFVPTRSRCLPRCAVCRADRLARCVTP